MIFIPFQVTTSCTAGTGANTIGRFIGIKQNGEAIGVAYDPVGTGLELPAEAPTGRFPMGACDCATDDSCSGQRS